MEIEMIFVAGMQSYPTMFEAIGEEIKLRTNNQVRVHALFPYGYIGDQKPESHWFKQMLTIGIDTFLKRGHGQHFVYHYITPYFKQNKKVILIGHSGGGIAAYEAAELSYIRDGHTIEYVVQIGSPKIKILPSLKSKVIYACDERDWVAKIAPGWNFKKTRHAPQHRKKIQLEFQLRSQAHTGYFWGAPSQNYLSTLESFWDFVREK